MNGRAIGGRRGRLAGEPRFRDRGCRREIAGAEGHLAEDDLRADRGCRAKPTRFRSTSSRGSSGRRAPSARPRSARKARRASRSSCPAPQSLRRLSDPFDPEEAIPAAASYLRDLVARFGNIGLAAAAYNAGEQRVSDWLAGEGGLPYETQDYVLAITGRAAEDWTERDPNLIAGGAPPKAKAAQSCLTVAATARQARRGVGGRSASIPKGPWAPWGVQVAGNFSLNRAMASFAAVQRKFPAIVTGPPMVVRKVSRSRGPAPLFQIRLPAPDQKQANGICRRLEAAGGACIVFRN